jgi:hypothetical protein
LTNEDHLMKKMRRLVLLLVCENFFWVGWLRLWCKKQKQQNFVLNLCICKVCQNNCFASTKGILAMCYY